MFQITTWKRKRKRKRSSVLPCLNGNEMAHIPVREKFVRCRQSTFHSPTSQGGIPLNQVLYAIFVDMQSLPGALYPEHQCRHREPQPEVDDHAQKPQRNIEHAAHETAGRILLYCATLTFFCFCGALFNHKLTPKILLFSKFIVSLSCRNTCAAAHVWQR